MRYSVRLLSKSPVAGEFRYLGAPGSATVAVGPVAGRTRPPIPTAFPAASRIGKITRERNLS
jgi:hypothetical protein